MTETVPTTEHVDPATLLIDTNVRLANSVDKAFVDDIRAHGVLVPLVAVRTTDGALRVRYGHRRTLAAIEAALPTVPVYIVGAEDDDTADRIVRQMAENERRTNLTTGDRVAAVEQLSLLGLTASAIAKRTHTPRAQVDDALRAAGSELARAAADRWDFLTLDMASAVAEFDDDPDTVKALVAAGKDSPGQFAHAAQRARDTRTRARAAATLTAELVTAGTTVVERPSWDDRAARGVRELTDADGQPITGETHASCPGHAAYLEPAWGDQPYRPVYVCTDWKANGHRDANRASTAGAMSDTDKAERRTVIANNKAWKSAETVRPDWLSTFLARKSPPKAAAAYLAGELLRGTHELRRAMERRTVVADVLGIADAAALDSHADAATDARATVLALAVVLCAYEQSTSVQTWRRPDGEIRRYFAFLAANGYECADVEKLCTQPPKRRRTTAA